MKNNIDGNAIIGLLNLVESKGVNFVMNTQPYVRDLMYSINKGWITMVHVEQAQARYVANLKKAEEKRKEDQFIKDKLIEQAEEKKRQEEVKVRILQEELASNRQKTEQERQKAEQELQKARTEAEKARLAANLANKGEAGDIAAAKTLMGTWESKGVNPWMIAGISVGALVVGGIVYKILGKKIAS
ncbi:MAG: hypothetical protein PHT69_01990 [Bacteroidales bacterium]|nr:hypothetical protein [Bacteroidales bacterium]